MKRLIVLATIVIGLLAEIGCADERESKVGGVGGDTVIAPDTPDNWWTFTRVVDAQLRAQLSGSKPPGGLESWDELWLDMIRAHQESQQNYERYIRYIVTERRKHGLPDLPSYGPEAFD